MTILALIDENTKFCVNITTDDRPAHEVQVAGYIVLDLETTPAIDYVWNDQTQAYDEFEGVGNGGIGDKYINGKLVQQLPPQYEPTSGIQDI